MMTRWLADPLHAAVLWMYAMALFTWLSIKLEVRMLDRKVEG